MKVATEIQGYKEGKKKEKEETTKWKKLYLRDVKDVLILHNSPSHWTSIFIYLFTLLLLL